MGGRAGLAARLRAEIAAALGEAGVPEADEKAAELVRRYGEPGRFYHGLRHLADLFRLFAAHRALVRSPEAFLLALVYHDAVYDPGAGDNEERSAALAMAHLEEAAAGQVDRERVRELILATRGHEPPPGAGGDFALLLDMDLAILGAPPATYGRYARAIRREYAHLREADYRAGRKQVLARFLARERIYRTEPFFKAYEGRARQNLARESEELGREG